MAQWPEGEFLLPLFPLPNLVFFPQTRMPLHIFEPRYRQMIADAVAGEMRFGIVLLKPGWETDYFGVPAVHPLGTLSIIEQAVPLDDGRFNILVRGEVRIEVVDEVSRDPYRLARVVARPEHERDAKTSYEQRTWLAELSRQYLHYLPDQTAVPEIDTVGLEPLTNALIMSLNLEAEEKQRLLEINDLIARAEEVASELQRRIETLEVLAPFRKDGGDPKWN
jgi:Lon protease-like protein